MSQPTAYDPAHEFLTDEAANPNFPGSELDIEFAALQATLDQTLANLALIQRDDGALKNGVVTVDSLDTVLAAAFGDLTSLADVEALIAQADADVVLTHADVALTHADVVLTHADVALTHADVVLTHADVVSTAASAATATTQAGLAANAAAALAFKFTWSTSTSGDPGTGKIAVNNASPGSATALNISETDANANSLAAEIARWDDATNANGKSRIKIAKDATNFLLLTITSSVTDNGAYDSFSVSGASLAGTLANGDVVYVQPALSGNDGSGDFTSSVSVSVDGEMVLFNGTTGKSAKRSTLTGGMLKSTSGVPAIASEGSDYWKPGGTDVAVADGGTGSSTAAGALTNLTARGQGKETIFIPAAAMVSRTTNGPSSGSVELSTNKIMVRSLDFDTTTQEFAQFSVWFPKSWNLGTVTFQPSFSQLTTASGGVVFGLAGGAVSSGDDLDAALGTAQTSTTTAGTLNKEYQGPESSAITIAGTPAAGDRVIFQINRTVADAGDTLAQDARLHGVRLFFTTNATTDA